MLGCPPGTNGVGPEGRAAAVGTAYGLWNRMLMGRGVDIIFCKVVSKLHCRVDVPFNATKWWPTST